MLDRVRLTPAPLPVLAPEQERQLTDRQRQILDDLEKIFNNGFTSITMADLAARLNCSLRTLYGLAKSRNQLVLVVTDRRLRAIGRSAHAAINAEMSAIEAIRAYLSAATVAVSKVKPSFAADMESMPEGRQLHEAHSNYLVQVTRTLLDIAVERQEIRPVDAVAVAHVIAGFGRDFARPGVLPHLDSSPKKAADDMVEIVLAGLQLMNTTTNLQKEESCKPE